MIEIKYNPSGDSRTGNKNVSFDEFHEANLSHINDVKNIIDFMAKKMQQNAQWHDYSKIEYEHLFYTNYLEALNGEKDFKDNEFYGLHVQAERHHPNESLKADINLLDIIEMISDSLAASLARTGKTNTDIKLNDGILELAFKNTIELINKNLQLKK